MNKYLITIVSCLIYESSFANDLQYFDSKINYWNQRKIVKI